MIFAQCRTSKCPKRVRTLCSVYTREGMAARKRQGNCPMAPWKSASTKIQKVNPLKASKRQQ